METAPNTIEQEAFSFVGRDNVSNKVCIECREEKTVGEFRKGRNICRACNREKNKEWQENNIKNELCIRCSRPNIGENKVCLECRNKRKIFLKTRRNSNLLLYRSRERHRREEKRKKGLCKNCDKPANGRYLCIEHMEKAKQRVAK